MPRDYMPLESVLGQGTHLTLLILYLYSFASLYEQDVVPKNNPYSSRTSEKRMMVPNIPRYNGHVKKPVKIYKQNR